MDLDDFQLPLSQAANEAFQSNPAQRQPIGPTSFGAAFSQGMLGSQQLSSANGFSLQQEQAPVIHGKLINDPIHGAYRLDAACTTIFDTRQFQRLRRLKQLGLT